MIKKSVCRCCGKMATYCYMPGYSDDSSPFFCYDCVPKGCSCNEYNINQLKPEGIEGIDWEMVDKSKVHWQKLDIKGNPYTCCEFVCDEEGFYIEEYLDHLVSLCEEYGFDLYDDEIDIQDIYWNDSLVNRIEDGLIEKGVKI